MKKKCKFFFKFANPSDEFAQNVSKKKPFRTKISSFSSNVQNLTVFFDDLHDSNSIFRAGRFRDAQ